MPAIGNRAVMETSDVVLEALIDAGGFLPMNDQSSPDEFLRRFSMSKKAFKKIIGGLMKQGVITITPEGIQQVNP